MYKMKAERFVGSYGELLRQYDKYETTGPCFNVYSSDKVQPGHLGDMGDMLRAENTRVWGDVFPPWYSGVVADPCSHQT